MKSITCINFATVCEYNHFKIRVKDKGRAWSGDCLVGSLTSPLKSQHDNSCLSVLCLSFSHCKLAMIGSTSWS